MARTSKRQEREQEELERLQSTLPGQEGDASSADESAEPQKGSGGLFSALQGEDNEDESDEEVSDPLEKGIPMASKGNKKKAKKNQKASDDAPRNASSKGKAKKAHKGKKGGNKGKKEPSQPVDDVDAVLNELEKKGELRKEERKQENEPKGNAMRDVFSVNSKNLDPELEMRAFFGSSVIQSQSAAVRPRYIPKSIANNPHHALRFQRNNASLITPRPEWPAPAFFRTLLQIKETTPPNLEDAKGLVQGLGEGSWYEIEHTAVYKTGNFEVMQFIEAGDPEYMRDEAKNHPYNMTLLLQMAELHRYMGDKSLSDANIDLCIYMMSCVLPNSLLSGGVRLDYSKIENRLFYQSLWQKLASLVQKGTWKTALEWCKLALSLGGPVDPLGLLCLVDYLSMKVPTSYEWFMEFLQVCRERYPGLQVDQYPGIAYAKAVVEFRKAMNKANKKQGPAGDDGLAKAKGYLREAILAYPIVVPLIYADYKINAPDAFQKNEAAAVETKAGSAKWLTSLLCELFVTRALHVFREAELKAWFMRVVNETAPELGTSEAKHLQSVSRLSEDPNYVPGGIMRALVISGYDGLVTKYVPLNLRARTQFSFDPLPPEGKNVTHFDDAYYGELGVRSGMTNPNVLDLLNVDQLREWFQVFPDLQRLFTQLSLDEEAEEGALAGEDDAGYSERDTASEDDAADGADEANVTAPEGEGQEGDADGGSLFQRAMRFFGA